MQLPLGHDCGKHLQSPRGEDFVILAQLTIGLLGIQFQRKPQRRTAVYLMSDDDRTKVHLDICTTSSKRQTLRLSKFRNVSFHTTGLVSSRKAQLRKQERDTFAPHGCSRHKKEPNSNGLHPKSDGLQPDRNGLQPSSDDKRLMPQCPGLTQRHLKQASTPRHGRYGEPLYKLFEKLLRTSQTHEVWATLLESCKQQSATRAICVGAFLKSAESQSSLLPWGRELQFERCTSPKYHTTDTNTKLQNTVRSQPNRNGLQPTSDGLHPNINSLGLHLQQKTAQHPSCSRMNFSTLV